jgi:hypothetical protein
MAWRPSHRASIGSIIRRLLDGSLKRCRDHAEEQNLPMHHTLFDFTQADAVSGWAA